MNIFQFKLCGLAGCLIDRRIFLLLTSSARQTELHSTQLLILSYIINFLGTVNKIQPPVTHQTSSHGRPALQISWMWLCIKKWNLIQISNNLLNTFSCFLYSFCSARKVKEIWRHICPPHWWIVCAVKMCRV